jgi:Protein of unknown function (DUF3349)
MALRSSLTSIISWLRAGYSAESPERGYLPLLALMARKLTDADIAAIANELASASHPATAHAIREAIGARHPRPAARTVSRIPVLSAAMQKARSGRRG